MPLARVVAFDGVDSARMAQMQSEMEGSERPENVPAKEIEAFLSEMREAKVDWQMVNYGGAVHSFTDLDATGLGLKGAAYDEKADHRSWETMKDFFSEIFAR